MKVAEESKKEEEDVFCVWGHDPFKQEAAEEDEKKYQEIQFKICDDETELNYVPRKLWKRVFENVK